MVTTSSRAQVNTQMDIRLDSLSDGPGILLFKLGDTKIISHDHTFLQEIDLDRIQEQVTLVQRQLTETSSNIPNHSFPFYKHKILYILDKLNKITQQLDSFKPRRVRRGLINPLGTFIKSVTGNLDNDDALKFENALKIIQKNDQQLSTSFNKHISIYKDLTLQQTQVLNNLTTNQKKLQSIVNYLLNASNSNREYVLHNARLSQVFDILSANAQDLLLEISRLENIIAFSYTNSMHHSLLSIRDLGNMVSKLKELYGSDSILSLEVRYYYDIIKLGSYFSDNRLVIVLKFPIIYPSTYDLYRLCPVPNTNSEIILPPLPYIAINSKEFVYMETECPKTETWYICEQKIIHQTRTQRDCISQLIHKQEVDKTCSRTAVKLTKEGLLELDSQHYIISFPRKTRVQTTCGAEKHRILTGSFLATIPRNCSIKATEFTIINIDDKVRGHAVEIMTLPKSLSLNSTKSLTHYNLTTINLDQLHNIQQQILTEIPTRLSTADSSSIYHTTIPTYSIVIFGAAALIILLYRHRRRVRSATPTNIELSTVNANSTSIAETLQDRRAATFALDISK